MSKSNLKDKSVVQLRNGECMIVVLDDLYGGSIYNSDKSAHILLNQYDENLKVEKSWLPKDKINSPFDVVKVYNSTEDIIKSFIDLDFQ